MCMPVLLKLSVDKDCKRLNVGLASCAVRQAQGAKAEDRHGAWLGDMATRWEDHRDAEFNVGELAAKGG